MNEAAIEPRGENFSPEEIERCLLALALNGGNTRRTRKMLKLDGTLQRPPSNTVLHEWKHAHADRYQELLQERAPDIEQVAIHDYRAIVLRGAQTQLQATEQAAKGIKDLTATDAARVAKDIAISTGVAADKLLVFTDRPNQIHTTVDPQRTIDSLMRALGIPRTVNSTAKDITSTPEIALPDESERANAREDTESSSPPA